MVRVRKISKYCLFRIRNHSVDAIKVVCIDVQLCSYVLISDPYPFSFKMQFIFVFIEIQNSESCMRLHFDAVSILHVGHHSFLCCSIHTFQSIVDGRAPKYLPRLISLEFEREYQFTFK